VQTCIWPSLVLPFWYWLTWVVPEKGPLNGCVYGVRSHFYADDSQLYISARPHEAANAASQLVDCVEAMAQWMASNRLKLNLAKTDFMRCTTRQRQHQLSREALMFGSVTIQPASTVRDLGVILDPELSLGPYINHLVSRCFYQLRRIKAQ